MTIEVYGEFFKTAIWYVYSRLIDLLHEAKRVWLSRWSCTTSASFYGAFLAKHVFYPVRFSKQGGLVPPRLGLWLHSHYFSDGLALSRLWYLDMPIRSMFNLLPDFWWLYIYRLTILWDLAVEASLRIFINANLCFLLFRAIWFVWLWMYCWNAVFDLAVFFVLSVDALGVKPCLNCKFDTSFLFISFQKADASWKLFWLCPAYTDALIGSRVKRAPKRMVRGVWTAAVVVK